MPTFGFGRKDRSQFFTTEITNKVDLQELKKYIIYLIQMNKYSWSLDNVD